MPTENNIEDKKTELYNYIQTLRKKLEKTVIENNLDFTNPLVVSMSQELDIEITSYQRLLFQQSYSKD